jgi:hypothetical protein
MSAIGKQRRLVAGIAIAALRIDESRITPFLGFGQLGFAFQPVIEFAGEGKEHVPLLFKGFQRFRQRGKASASSPASALDGPPSFVASTNLTPFDSTAGVYYGVTMQPPYIPSGNGIGTPQTGVNPDAATTVPPQTNTTIGDLLSAANVSWTWYAAGMQYAIDHGVYNGAAGLDPRGNIVPNFQAHHNPFDYYANLRREPRLAPIT